MCYVFCVTGVCHADDLQYLFPVSDGLFPDQPPDEHDKIIAQIITSLWVSFAKTGFVYYFNY